MECIKVLLVSSFSAAEGNKGLVLELQKQLSSCSGSGARDTEMQD
jgi:hypothetical protein